MIWFVNINRPSMIEAQVWNREMLIKFLRKKEVLCENPLSF